MRQLLAGQFPAQIVLTTAITSMKWPFNVVVATRRRFYAPDRKGNGTTFGGLRRTVDTNLRSLIQIKMPLAQLLRSSDEIGPVRNPCACQSSQNLDTLVPFPHRT